MDCRQLMIRHGQIILDKRMLLPEYFGVRKTELFRSMKSYKFYSYCIEVVADLQDNMLGISVH